MYRAKVEQINGVNVRAGGKWLKRIGNKNFRVGDYVWTDGRCVYGYDQESMTPFVPQTPQEKEVIPIQYNDKLYYIYNGVLHYLKELPEQSNSIVNSNRKILFSSFDKIQIYQSMSATLSANCDKKGDIFAISVRQPSKTTDDRYISIAKNQEILKKIPLAENEKVIWGFIENADNWAYIVIDTEYSETPSGACIDFLWQGAENDKWDNEHDDFEYDELGNIIRIPEGSIPLEEYYEAIRNIVLPYLGGDYQSYSYSGAMTLIDSHGQRENFLTFEGNVSRDFISTTSDYYFSNESGSWSINSEKMSSIKFPMQDRFYFTMQKPISVYRDIIGFPSYAEKTIYSPNDEKIFTGYFKIQTNFLACRDGNNYLINGFALDLGEIDYMGTLEGKPYHTAIPTEPVAWVARNWQAAFDYAHTQNFSLELYNEILPMNISYSVDSKGNITPQGWYQWGYNLRKLPKSKLHHIISR